VADLSKLCDIRLHEFEQLEPMEEDGSSQESYNLEYLEKLLAKAAQSKGNTLTNAVSSDLGIWKVEKGMFFKILNKDFVFKSSHLKNMFSYYFADYDWSKCALGVLPWAN